MIFGKVTTKLYFVSSIKQVRDNVFHKNFYIYYITQCGYPSDWSMECFLEYIIPKEISVEVSDEKYNE